MADVLKSLNLLETLKESMEKNKISDVKDAVEDMLISRISIAVAGERSLEKVAFLNSLRGLGPEDEGAAPFPYVSSPDELVVHPCPRHPDFRLWDLPAFPEDSKFDPEVYMERYKFLRFNVSIITFPQSPHANSVTVWHEARALKRETVYFALLASEKDTDKTLEAKRKASLDVLKTAGVALPRVFLVRPKALEKLDFPKLLEAMEDDLPGIRAHALLLALPTLSAEVVTRKRDAFKALAWAAASLSGGVSAIPVPLVASMVDASVAVRILTKAQISLCLDNDAIERLAQQRGKDAAQLKALRTCVLSVEVTKSEVKSRLAAAESDISAASTGLMRLAMPRNARTASRSFTIMQQALSGAIDEMAADAEKLVAIAARAGQ